MPLRDALLLAALCLPAALAAQTPAPTPTPVPTPTPAPAPPGLPGWQTGPPPSAANRNPFILEDGALPDYDDLRLPGGTTTQLNERYLESLPILTGELVDDRVIFADVPADAPYARLTLSRLVDIALENNFDLVNTDRSVLIAKSSTRQSEADFIPFVDLVGGTRYTETVDESARPLAGGAGTNTTRTDSFTANGGAETGVSLPSGGSITGSVGNDFANTRSRDRDASLETDSYGADANVRVLQPLLRGGGTGVGTAALRRARLSEIDAELSQRTTERDTVLRVIQTYFNLSSTAQQLQVSRDAIRERKRFYEETLLKYDVGRVAESEILRAEIQYLQELESAISRRQSLDDARESLLLLLGLPLDTRISLVDVTLELQERGRVDIPPLQEAIDSALNTRPELLQQEIALAQSRIGLEVSRNDVLPQLDADAGYGRSDRNDNFREANEFKDSEWSAGLSLRVPLINIRRREALKQSALQLEQAETRLLQFERSITRDVINAHRAVLSTEATLTILQKTVEQARKNLELINGSFEVGFSSVTDVRLAQDDLFQAETRYRTALLTYQTTIAQLYLEMGRPLY
ncbi:MAG: TolC family protein [Candidatus Sumerlaeia bacterium]|nr:TolC family protein [Candidatus Sumerlaeia bacterium]